MSNESVLIRDNEGRMYHLRLHPEEIANTIILVGDPKRSELVAERFDRIDVRRVNREYTTFTGEYKGHRLTVLSTGIGAGGVEVALNELDALVNIDHKTGLPKEHLTSLNFIRFGTAGALQPDTPIGSAVISKAAFAVDGLMQFYAKDTKEDLRGLESSLYDYFDRLTMRSGLYVADADPDWLNAFAHTGSVGLTFTCNGFFAPQGRALRLPIRYPDLLDHAQEFEYEGLRITNLEMETAVIYGLAHQLGHRALSLSAILANRHHDEAGSCDDVVRGALDSFMSCVLAQLEKENAVA